MAVYKSSMKNQQTLYQYKYDVMIDDFSPLIE